jgi:hypothetical protein
MGGEVAAVEQFRNEGHWYSGMNFYFFRDTSEYVNLNVAFLRIRTSDAMLQTHNHCLLP